MKNIILTAMLLFALVSCEKENNDPKPVAEKSITSSWYLTEANRYPTICTFEEAQIRWDFYDDNTVKVTIAEGTDVSGCYLLPLPINGTYQFEQDSAVMLLANTHHYYYQFTDNRLLLKESQQAPADDGGIITFVKKE